MDLVKATHSTGASSVAVRAVIEVLRDGRGRTDEEITFEVNDARFQARIGRERRWSQDTIRHARLALELAEMVVRAGAADARRTSNGGLGTVWRKAR